VIATFDRTLSPGTAFNTKILKDSIESALVKLRTNSLTEEVTDFQRCNGSRRRFQYGAIRCPMGTGIRCVCFGAFSVNSIKLWENASEGSLQTNCNFAQASHDIEAVHARRQAATRGRSDVIPAYQALRPEEQAAFRSRYVDPLIVGRSASARTYKDRKHSQICRHRSR
jgi:hypothetical protein